MCEQQRRHWLSHTTRGYLDRWGQASSFAADRGSAAPPPRHTKGRIGGVRTDVEPQQTGGGTATSSKNRRTGGGTATSSKHRRTGGGTATGLEASADRRWHGHLLEALADRRWHGHRPRSTGGQEVARPPPRSTGRREVGTATSSTHRQTGGWRGHLLEQSQRQANIHSHIRNRKGKGVQGG